MGSRFLLISVFAAILLALSPSVVSPTSLAMSSSARPSPRGRGGPVSAHRVLVSALPAVAPSGSHAIPFLSAVPGTTLRAWKQTPPSSRAATGSLGPLITTRTSSLGTQATVSSASFEGIDMTCCDPPDGAIAAGLTYVMYAANDGVDIYNKVTGNVVLTTTFESFFSVLGLPSYAVYTDPRLAYDAATGRYVFLIDVVDLVYDRNWVAIAASATGDPTTFWWEYALDETLDGSIQSLNWADQPSLGMDSQAVYISTSQYS